MKNKHWKQAAEAHGGKLGRGVQRTHDAVKAGHTEQERCDNFVDAFVENIKEMRAHGATIDDYKAALVHTVTNIAIIEDGVRHGISDTE